MSPSAPPAPAGAPRPPGESAPPADVRTGRTPREHAPPGIEALVAAELPEADEIAPGPPGARWLHHPPRDLHGLALSGGGIRSATFNLGVLQGLHELQLLRSFDYVSSVSGGGYIGAFWTAWRGRRPGREGRFPSDVPDGAAEPREVRHLREFSNFLVPRLGVFSYDTGRALVAGISAMLPTLLAAVSVVLLGLLGWVAAAWLIFGPGRTWAGSTAALLGVTAFTLVAFEAGWARRREPADGAAYPLGCVLALLATGAAWGVVRVQLLPVANHRPGQFLPGVAGERLLLEWGHLFAPGAAWAAALLALVCLRWFLSRAAESPRFHSLRRSTDRVRSRLLFLIVGWGVVTTLWLTGVWVEGRLAEAASPLGSSAVAAAGASLLAAFIKAKQILSHPRSSSAAFSLVARLRPLLPQLLAYAVIVLMVLGAVCLLVAAGRRGGVFPLEVRHLALGSAATTLLILLLMDPNELGLHAFYRGRLVRTFPGASNDARPGENRETELVEGDDLPMDRLVGAARRPFPLVCCTANDLTARDALGSLGRGAASAVLSPVGCSVDGAWAPWSEYPSVPSLGGAITASGAAFNTLMGSFSRRLGPAVTFVAAALNLRLGMWIAHPARPAGRRLLPGLPFYLEMFGVARAAGPGPVHLSDGGHFENTGVYELIRRHCRVVLACDCGADGESAFDDLGNLVRRVREDFGVEIRIDTRPLRVGADGLSLAHMVAGDIHYPDGDTGTLLLLKPVLTGTEPVDVQQYRTRNPAFPHESTGDQFYDEAQWESYRRLGVHSVHAVLGALAQRVELHRPGRSDAALRREWSDVFARARRRWLPNPGTAPSGLGDFQRRAAELEAEAARDCPSLLRQVYRELPDRGGADRRVRVGELPLVGLAGGAEVERGEREAPAQEPGCRTAVADLPQESPADEDRVATLPLVRRALLLVEDVFEAEDLARNHAHPRYLAVMNWIGRWFGAPRVRLWWPLLRPMHGPALADFLEQHFGLPSLQAGSPGSERVRRILRRVGPAPAHPSEAAAGVSATAVSFYLGLADEGAGHEVLVGRLQAELAAPSVLVWNAGDFRVPVGLWGAGIGSEFLRELTGTAGRELIPELRYLVARVAGGEDGGRESRKRAADEIQLYRANGFREAHVAAGVLRCGGAAVRLPDTWVRRESPGTQWMVASVPG